MVMSWSTFDDEKTFSTWGGVFTVEEPIKPVDDKFPCSICNICIRKMKVEPLLSVECHVCHDKFQSTFDRCYEQAWGCASYISETGISCGYGSDKDCTSYGWTAKIKPEEYKDKSNICDTCINRLIENNTIVHLKSW